MPLFRPAPIALAAMLCMLPAASARASPTCEGLAEAPPVADSEALRWADTIWRSVAATEHRVGGQATPPSIHWVGGAEGVTSGAWYCPDTDTVHVTAALVEYAWSGRRIDGASLLGFVLAHELAHRRFEPRSARSMANDGACDAVPTVEVRADERAAFLLALTPDPTAGRALSPFQLDRRDTLAAFLANELGWPAGCQALAARVEAVHSGITRMRELGRAYDTAIALALIDAAPQRLPELLAAIDTSVNGGAPAWSAVPELKLARALLHLARAQRAGWCPDELARSPLSPSPCSLRCLPIAPGHALLAPRDASGDRSAPGLDRDLELAAVRRLLDEATRLGAPPEQTLGLAVCEGFVAGDAGRRDEALTRLARAVAAAPSLAAMVRATTELAQVSRLQSFLLEAPSPIGSQPWLDGLRDLRDGWGPATDLNALVATWLGETSPTPIAELAPSRDAPRLEAWVRAEPCVPAQAIDLAGGWRLATSPTCAEIGTRGERVARLVEAVPTALSRSPSDWTRYCTLEVRGTDDGGRAAFVARCPAWDGPGSGWLLIGDGERWRRVVRFSP